MYLLRKKDNHEKTIVIILTPTSEEICNELGLNYNDILNAIHVGSRYIGSRQFVFRYDFIIVYKQSLLPSGSFKDNAISSNDRMIQGTCYSRGGFIDAINNYQMPALEAIFLPDNKVVKKTIDFKVNKFDKKILVKKVISLASASWHNAVLSYKSDNQEYVGKKYLPCIKNT